MPYDEQLADRVRALLPDLHDGALAEEKKMFGGLAFMVAGRMAVCVSGQGGLLLRAPAADEAAAWRELDGVGAMVMGARVSDTWVHVTAPVLADEAALGLWLRRGLGGPASVTVT